MAASTCVGVPLSLKVWDMQRLQGKRVTFITGTDEHGEKIALAAEKRGMAPKEHCDDIVASYKDLWKQVRF